MPTRRKRRQSPLPNSRGRRRKTRPAAVEEPAPVNSTDPFERLDPDCCNLVLDHLTLSALGRCAQVSTSWNFAITSWIASSGFSTHFPSAENPRESGGGDALVVQEFKRLASQDRALWHGEATSGLRLTNTSHLTIAGDFVAWSSPHDGLHYQHLQEGAKAMKLSVGPCNRHNTVVGMDLNLDGCLLVSISVGPSIYAPYDNDLPRERWHTVYSLPDQKVLWKMVSTEVPGCQPKYSPLRIGRDRIYLARRSREKSYDLVAVDFRTGTRLYQTPVVANIHDKDSGDIPEKTLQLVRLGKTDERIVQFDSSRLLYEPMPASQAPTFTIIDGANGRSQTMDYPRRERRDRVYARANSNSIALLECWYSHVSCLLIQKLSRRSDGTFVRTAEHLVTPGSGMLSLAMDPFTFHAFALAYGRTWVSPLRAILTSDQESSQSSTDDLTLAGFRPACVVNAYSCVLSGQELTLPPRKPGGPRRRALSLPWRRNWYASLDQLDNSLLVMSHKTHDARDTYLFSFGPKAHGSQGEEGQ
ncbi:hypothetical protein AYL99_09622 [Fonsecaea erecta]|uniref:F-box domain-containing protein n=1 Tax=Fonsecaea erecta TaxID=1367422 RepID=A0A178ZB76_9EURO|nr:hypothetical protein AYL99_09622 [Fonsecaea erecta]OAP56443.1 hypothetical protein AYL99_09622 [Fonsecaea erecta]